VPAKIVENIIANCQKKNVKYAIIISSGFAEQGKSGKILQNRINDMLKDSPLRIIGPNCLGIINTDNNLNATFAAPKLIKGNVAAVFQSGALGAALLDWANEYNFGFSKFISLGNKIDIEESELIEYLAEDDDTKVIALYLEDIRDTKKFYSVCREASSQKPIIILKGGMTVIGAKAAFSHTAAMVTPRHIIKAVFSQSNLIVAKTIEDLLNLIQVLSWEPAATSKNIAIISNAGGPAILATDVASRCGLHLPKLHEEVLNNVLPEIASSDNPIDLGGQASAKDYRKALDYCLNNKMISSIVGILTPQTSTEIEETAKVFASFNNAKKPIVVSFLGDRLVDKGISILKDAHVPHFDTPEEAVKALASSIKYWKKDKQNYHLIDFNSTNSNANCDNVYEVIENYNIPFAEFEIVNNFDEAIKISKNLGYPLVAKNISGKFVHKHKAGKVVLGINDNHSFKLALKKVSFPALIQKMINLPFEVIVGVKQDIDAGAVLTFGWGGIYTEEVSDIAVRISPLTLNDLDEMIKETKIGRILHRENIDLSVLKNIMIELLQISIDNPRILEIEINPIKLSFDKTICVDARMKVSEVK